MIQNNNPSQLDPHAKIKVSNTTATVQFNPDINRQLEFACAGLGIKEFSGFAGQFVVQYDVERDAQGGEVGSLVVLQILLVSDILSSN